MFGKDGFVPWYAGTGRGSFVAILEVKFCKVTRGIDEGGGYRSRFPVGNSAKGNKILSVVLVREVDTENMFREGV